MKMTVGVKSVAEARYFLGQGAHELYCGLAGKLNIRLPRENLAAAEGAGEIIDLARGAGARVFLAVNDIVPEKLYRPALRLIEGLKERGLFGIIVRDPAFLAWLKARKVRSYVVLSTLALCFNRGALEFFARLGIDRLVLPMQMTPENAAYALKNRLGIETEVFCQRLYYGVNVDSMCFLPCPQTAEDRCRRLPDFTCLLPFRSASGVYRMPMPEPGYMLDAFYDFYKGGAGYVKIARWPNTDRQIDLFNKVRYLVKLLEKGASREIFMHEGLKLETKPLQYGKSFTYRPVRA